MSSSLIINLDDLLHRRGIESNRVEFKASWNPDAMGDQVLRTLCAFANDLQNLNGGYLILGVEEKDGVAQLPPKGLAPEELDAIQRWVRGQCKRLTPEYQPVLSPEVFQGKHLLVMWAPASDTRPHQAPESLKKGAGYRYYIRLSNESVVAQDEMLTSLLQQTARVPFDDRRALDTPLEKLRESKVREFLSEVRSGLLEEQDAREIYRRMYLSSRVNGHEVPRNVGLLFFSDDPDEWFPGARIEVAQFADDSGGDVIEEKVFKGPLHEQVRSCLNYLRHFSTKHLEKSPERPDVKGWVSYPLPALEESVVNALYHRSYEGVREPTKIYLYPNRIELISYPGPVPGIQREHLQSGARIPPVPARNRRIGEFFKELRLAEQRGSGVPKVYRAMQQNGSPPPVLDFDEDRSYFRVTLPAHPEYVAISALRDAAHLRAIGDSAGALRRIQTAFDERPASSILATALIEEYARMGALTEARQVYERFAASPAATGLVRAAAALSNAYLDSGLKIEAKALLDQFPAMFSPEEAFSVAILEKRAGRLERAHRYFEKAGSAVLQDVRALHEFAQIKMKLAGRTGRSPKASQFQRDARRRLLRDAQDMLRRVLQMDAPPMRHAWAWYDLGRVLQWLGAPQGEVRNAFEEACRIEPKESRFREELEKSSGRT